MNKYEKQFDDLVYFSLFSSSTLSSENIALLNDIERQLEKDNDILRDINILKNNSTQENRFRYDYYIKLLLNEANLSYEQIISSLDSEYKYILFSKLSLEMFIKYLKNEEVDVSLINHYIKNNKDACKEVIKRINIIKSDNLYLDIEKKDLGVEVLEKCSKDFVTNYILTYFKDFKKFLKLVEKDSNILNKINSNSLNFNKANDEEVISYIKENITLAYLFNNRYYNSLDMDTLQTIYNRGEINSSILEELIKRGSSPIKILSKNDVIKCDNGTINHPLDGLSSDIVDNYKVLKKFTDYEIVSYIDDAYDEAGKIFLLRNNDFINNMSNYTIELIVNSLSFKSLFNMIQNHDIFSKISNINAKIYERDIPFVRGFLDSTLLVYKSNHNMILKMIMTLNDEVVLHYLTLPYIYDKLSNNDILSIIKDKSIDFKIIIENDDLFNKLTSSDIASYINQKHDDSFLTLISDKRVLKKLFNISDDVLSYINPNEVNYIFETIRTKDILSLQESSITVSSYRAVLACYLTFSITDSIELIVNGNKNININMLKKEINSILYHSLIDYRKDNYSLLQYIDRKIIFNLKDIKANNKEDFIKEITSNGYIRSIINLLSSYEFASISEIVDILFKYKQYENNFESKREISNYFQSFSVFLMNKKKNQLLASLETKARKQVKLKDSLKFQEYKRQSDSFLKTLKLEIFVNALVSANKEEFSYAFREYFDINDIKNKYKEYLLTDEFDIDNIINLILKPLIENKFDKYECLEKLNIKKPRDYDLYAKIISDINVVNEINEFMSSLDVDANSKIEILNLICYDTSISISLDKNIRNKIKELQYKAYEILGEIYIDKTTYKIIYSNTIDIDNEEDIIVYQKYIDIIEEIIKKTFNYLNRHMLNSKIKEENTRNYLNKIQINSRKYPLNSSNFTMKKRVYSLNDIERLFNCFTFQSMPKMSEGLKNLLFNNNLIDFISTGIYEGIVDNLGYIISSFDIIEEECKKRNLDILTLDIYDIKKILLSINNKYNLPMDVIMNAYSENYYKVSDVNERLSLLSKISDEAAMKNNSSIPMIGVSDNDYSLCVFDYQDYNNFLIDFNTDYRIGSSGSDLLTFSILSQNGFVLVIRDSNNEIVGRINGIRRGNAIFLTTPTLTTNINIDSLLNEFSMNICNYTKDSNEPIEIIVINNYDYGINIDNSTCNYINNPIDINGKEYENLKRKKLLINNDINKDFGGTTNVIYSTKPLDKTSFIDYYPRTLYSRIRNDIAIINGICNDETLRMINSIIYKWCLLNNSNDYKDIDIESYRCIYLASDYVILIDYNNEIISYILPFDNRAILETNYLLSNITKTNKELH